MDSFDSKLKTLFSLNHDPVIGVKGDTIIFCNAAAVRMFAANLEGKPALDYIPPHILLEEAENFISTATICGKHTSVSAAKVEGILILSVDASAVEDPMFMAVPPMYLNSLRSAMSNIKMSSDRLFEKLDAKNDSKLRRYSSILSHNYYIMLKLIENLGTVSDITSDSVPLTKEFVNMEKLCSELVSSVGYFTSDMGISISFECKDADMFAYVDSGKIEQLILNILANSIEHTTENDAIVVSLRKLCSKIVISIDDTGSGIPLEKLSGIFKKANMKDGIFGFEDSTGLGLYIARGIAELHGGAFLIESRPGEGTSVRIMLPANQDQKEGDRFSMVEAPYSAGWRNNLLIELSGVLRSEHYNDSNI